MNPPRRNVQTAKDLPVTRHMKAHATPLLLSVAGTVMPPQALGYDINYYFLAVKFVIDKFLPADPSHIAGKYVFITYISIT